jgi:hypothetical protein
VVVKGLLAGTDIRSITPTVGHRPVYLAGYGPDRLAEGVHDDLWVRTLALAVGEIRCALAACDLVGLSRPEVQAVEASLAGRGSAPEALIVACTHNHQGPDTLGLWGPDRQTSGLDRGYMAWLRVQIADSVEAALGAMRPARLRAAVVKAPAGVVKNIRDPGLLDDDLACLRAETPEGQPLATLVNFAAHPEAMGPHNTLITSDYPHYLRQTVEGAGGGTCLFFSGDLGGMMTPDVTENSWQEIERVGRRLAERALEALSQAPLVEAGHLSFRRTELLFPLENPLLQLAQQSGVLPRRFEETVEGPAVRSELALLTLGPVRILGVPGEVLPKLGMALKSSLPGDCRFLLGLANDELGYILPAEDFHPPDDYLDPGDHYEESMSLGPRTGAILEEGLRALLRG